MGSRARDELSARERELVLAWRVTPERIVDTGRSALVFGRRDDAPVVLKVLHRIDEEWNAGAVLGAFDGSGAVRVYEHCPGAMLMERLTPATALSVVAERNDDEAVEHMAAVIRQFPEVTEPGGMPTVVDWGAAFDTCIAQAPRTIDLDLVARARLVYRALADSQSQPRLLHGDLHHDNVAYDTARGWLAIDPKGVFGELEYELGAALRNPCDLPASALIARFDRRAHRFADGLGLNRRRIVAWAFSQAVLAAIWAAEDGDSVDDAHVWLSLARGLAPHAAMAGF